MHAHTEITPPSPDEVARQAVTICHRVRLFQFRASRRPLLPSLLQQNGSRTSTRCEQQPLRISSIIAAAVVIYQNNSRLTFSRRDVEDEADFDESARKVTFGPSPSSSELDAAFGLLVKQMETQGFSLSLYCFITLCLGLTQFFCFFRFLVSGWKKMKICRTLVSR